MKHFFGITLIALLTAGCAIFGDPTELDETKGWSAQKIYAKASEAMRDSDYEKAIKYFGIIESRYPHGKYALQAQLDTAYAYYKKPDPTAAIATADRFIKIHPHHPNVDYAYYLRGLVTFNERGIIDRLTKQDISDRDPKSMRLSFAALKELVTRFPDSKYAPDAIERMNYLTTTLAKYELHVARYYMKRQSYVAAVNRCKYVLEKYPDSPSQEEALVIMISAYDLMGLDDYKKDTLRVLETNYPNSRILSEGIRPPQEKTWWKFWEGLL